MDVGNRANVNGVQTLTTIVVIDVRSKRECDENKTFERLLSIHLTDFMWSLSARAASRSNIFIIYLRAYEVRIRDVSLPVIRGKEN